MFLKELAILNSMVLIMTVMLNLIIFQLMDLDLKVKCQDIKIRQIKEEKIYMVIKSQFLKLKYKNRKIIMINTVRDMSINL